MRPIDRALEAHLTTTTLGATCVACNHCGTTIAPDRDAVAVSRKPRNGRGPWETQAYCVDCGPETVTTPLVGYDQYVAVGCVAASTNATTHASVTLCDVRIVARALAGMGDRRDTDAPPTAAHRAAEGIE